MTLDDILPVATEKRQFECRHEINYHSPFSDILDHRDSDARTEYGQFFTGIVCCWLKALIATLLEEIKQVVVKKWSNWKSSFFKTDGIFFELSVCQDSETREKSKEFPCNAPVQTEGFKKLWWKNSPYLREKWYATSKKFGTICAFCRFLSVNILKRYDPANIFSKNFVFFVLRETRIFLKSDPGNWKKVQVLTFLFRKINRSVSFYFFWAY